VPSTLGHSIAGLAVAELFQCREGRVRRQALLMANAADLDMLPGLLTRRPPDATHGRVSHSLGAAVIVGVGAGLWEKARGRRFTPRFLQAAAAYGSHILLDYLGKTPGDGAPVWWPFSRDPHTSERHWFKTIISHSKERGFWKGLVNRSNVAALAQEAAVTAPVYLAARVVGKRLRAP
jgi:membrane-bound metal-dependent hydrolase YbcI (DUF457 family)